MPNRIISDITWKSKKVRQLPLEFRAEYTWTLPLFNEWGAAEYDPESIWHSAYALNRPDWTAEKVQKMCEALVSAGLWATWEHKGHTYAYLVGSDKPGLLPKPSDRNLKNPLRPPADLLAKHCGGDSAPEPPTSSPEPANGYGSGIGSGSGMGMGIGSGNGSGAGDILQNAEPRQTLPDTHTQNTEPKRKPEPNPVNQEMGKSTTKTPKLPFGYPHCGPEGCVQYFRAWVKLNPKATDTPANWEKLWLLDIQPLVHKWGVEGTCKLIEFSQTTKYKEYVFRGKTLAEYAEEMAGKLKLEPKKDEVIDARYADI